MLDLVGGNKQSRIYHWVERHDLCCSDDFGGSAVANTLWCVCKTDWSRLHLASLKLLQEDDEIKLSFRIDQDTQTQVIPAKNKILRQHLFLQMKFIRKKYVIFNSYLNLFQIDLKMILTGVEEGRNQAIFTGRLCDHYDLKILLNLDDFPDEKVGEMDDESLFVRIWYRYFVLTFVENSFYPKYFSFSEGKDFFAVITCR